MHKVSNMRVFSHGFEEFHQCLVPSGSEWVDEMCLKEDTECNMWLPVLPLQGEADLEYNCS